MEYGIIIGKQIVIMFIILIVGAVCYLKGLISKDGVKQLSLIELDLVNPLLIFMSYQKDITEQLVKGLLWSFLLSGISFALAIGASYILLKRGSDIDALRCSVIYSNCGFIGIPLINGLFGQEAVLYLTAYVTLFNFLVWTHGYMTMKGEKDFSSFKKALRSPSVIAVFVGLVCFFAGLRLPSVPAAAANYIADMNTPLAMLIAGATATQSNILKSLRSPRTAYICALKLLIIPLICMAAIVFIPAPDMVKMTVMIAGACPTATTCTMFAVTMGKNAAVCSEIFALTTVLSGATLPLLVTLAGSLM